MMTEGCKHAVPGVVVDYCSACGYARTEKIAELMGLKAPKEKGMSNKDEVIIKLMRWVAVYGNGDKVAKDALQAQLPLLTRKSASQLLEAYETAYAKAAERALEQRVTSPEQGLPEPADDPFYGRTYSVPVLVLMRHPKGKSWTRIACWHFGQDGWVSEGLREGPDVSDYEEEFRYALGWTPIPKLEGP